MVFGQTLTPLDFGGENLDNWSNYKTWTGQSITGTRRVLVPLSEDTDIVAGAQRDGSDIRITASDGVTQLPFELVGRNQYIAPRGNWTWFSRPQCISNDDGSKMWTAFITSDGFVVVAEYTASTGAYVYTRLRDSVFQADDHNNPSLFYRSDNKILVMYSKHDADDKVYYRVSSAANDTSSFAPEQSITFATSSLMSYVQLQTIGTDLYLFTRRGPQPQEWVYQKSTNDGDTWLTGGTEVNFWDPTGRAYIQTSSNGSRIDFLLTNGGPGDQASDQNQELYHIYFDGTDWFETDGTNLTASLPLDETDLDGTSSDIYTPSGTDRVWCNDIVYGTDSQPHVLFVEYPDGGSDGQLLKYANYSGSVWRDAVTVVLEGNGIGDDQGTSQERYNGGARFKKDDETGIWLARDVLTPTTAAGGAGVYEIEEWDNGGTAASPSWAKTQSITSGSIHKNFHPQPVVGGAVTDFEVVWCGYGPYTGFQSGEFQSGIQGYPGRRTWDNAYVKSDSAELVVYYGKSSGVSSKSNPTATWGGDYVFVCHCAWQRGDRLDRLPVSIGTAGTPQLATYWVGGIMDSRLPSINTDFTGQFTTTASREDCEWWDHGSNIDMANWSAAAIQCWAQYTAIYSNQHYPVSIGANATAGILLRADPDALDVLESRVSTDFGTEVNTDLTMADDGTPRQIYADFDGAAQEIDVRLNKTDATPTSTTGTQLDADASRALEVANFTPDLNTGWSGDIGEIRITNQTALAEAVTDDDYDMVNNSSWGAFGSEKSTPFSAGVAIDDLDNLAIWLRASDLAQSDDTDVTTWTSKEGNSYAFTQAGTDAEKPHYRDGASVGIGGQPAVSFDGSDDYLLNSDTNVMAQLQGTLFIVCRWPAALGSGGQYPFGTARGTVTNKYLYVVKASTSHDVRFVWQDGAANTVTADSQVWSADTDYLFMLQSTGTAYGLRLNGADVAFTPSGSDDGNWGADISGDLTRVALGCLYRTGAGNFAKILISEVVYYTDVLTAQEISDIEATLADLYGITLP